MALRGEHEESGIRIEVTGVTRAQGGPVSSKNAVALRMIRPEAVRVRLFEWPVR